MSQLFLRCYSIGPFLKKKITPTRSAAALLVSGIDPAIELLALLTRVGQVTCRVVDNLPSSPLPHQPVPGSSVRWS